MKTGAFFIMIVSVFLVACNSDHKESKVEDSSEPKTSYGRAIEKAHDVSDVSDDRNEELKKQADSIKDE